MNSDIFVGWYWKVLFRTISLLNKRFITKTTMTKAWECVNVLVAVKLNGVGVEKIREIYLEQLYIHFKGKYGNVIEVPVTVFHLLENKYLKKVFIVQMHGDIHACSLSVLHWILDRRSCYLQVIEEGCLCEMT